MKEKAINILREYFGYSSFRPGQEAIIDKILKGQDVLGIMPTGAGKSLCFQVPALCLGGTALVISPLISLMKDQVDTLNEMGVKAAFINSSLDAGEYRSIMSKARKGEYKMLYIAPERLDTDSFRELLAELDITLIAVDEAHCVSQWGHDFRPSYISIKGMIADLPQRPVVAAFTATATPRVSEDMVKLLGLREPYILVTGFDRENLYFHVEKPTDKFGCLLDIIKKHRKSSGIVYCSTRKTVEAVCEKLNKKGISATRYHAGLDEDERTANQEAFIYDKAQIIVATNAFGMGIDKSDIRYVVHYNMPRTMENYYQEAGRAGRDGEKADCILLYSAADIVMNKFLIENSGEGTDKAGEYKKLQEMTDYCNTSGCLRGCILRYFGEKDYLRQCGNCGNCMSDTEQTNIADEALKILSCIKRTGERFGSGMITDVLKGSASKRLKELGFDKLSTYGIMKEYSERTIKAIIAYLSAEGIIIIKGEKYPILTLAPHAGQFIKDNPRLMMNHQIVKEKPVKSVPEPGAATELFEVLRRIRREIADNKRVPPFVVFSDATLRDMCEKLPDTMDEMLDVSGVGKFKLEQYGSRFLKAINENKSRIISKNTNICKK